MLAVLRLEHLEHPLQVAAHDVAVLWRVFDVEYARQPVVHLALAWDLRDRGRRNVGARPGRWRAHRAVAGECTAQDDAEHRAAADRARHGHLAAEDAAQLA